MRQSVGATHSDRPGGRSLSVMANGVRLKGAGGLAVFFQSWRAEQGRISQHRRARGWRAVADAPECTRAGCAASRRPRRWLAGSRRARASRGRPRPCGRRAASSSLETCGGEATVSKQTKAAANEDEERDDARPAMSHLTAPLASLTAPLISNESFARQPRGLNESTHVSPVRWFLTSMSPLCERRGGVVSLSARAAERPSDTRARTSGR